MPKYIYSAEEAEITLKDRLNELGDKFAYIEQSVYLLEGVPSSVEEIIGRMNQYLDECMELSADFISDAFATTDISSATNTANIGAKPCVEIIGGECAKNFAEMVDNGNASIAITEIDDKYNKFAINESKIAESLHNADATIEPVDGADALLVWKVDTAFTNKDFDTLVAEVSRYFKAYKDLMGCADETVKVHIMATGNGNKQDKVVEI